MSDENQTPEEEATESAAPSEETSPSEAAPAPADETAELEEALEADPTTAEPEEPAPEEPADATPASDPEPAAPEPDPSVEPDPAPAEPAATPAPASPDEAAPESETAEDPEEPTQATQGPSGSESLATIQGALAQSRKAMIQEALEALEPETISEVDQAEAERKAGLLARLEEIQDERDALTVKDEELRAESTAVMAELYPHQVESDRHVDAVKGYLKASAQERATRAGNPQRLKEFLKKAGMSPIDAAFARHRARGAQRPTRSPVGVKPTGGDAAPQATPGQE